ncbi:alpha/beta hydrolase [Puia sp. P3]|uniref:alpha/beta hydrolase n=1 Tax=Puia sp. P3 TaxID=3423952 RepID=UPI003D669058
MKKTVLSILTLSIITLTAPAKAQSANPPVKNIVIVHGAFTDGSGWQKVHDLLKARGYKVTVAAPPNTGLDEDVAATNRAINQQDGPVILVGHSYGGAVITEAGNNPKVTGLVYVAAFLPDEGETLGKVVMSFPAERTAGGALPPDSNGYILYNPAKYHADFCADLSKTEADFMADSQMPIAASVFGYVFKNPAWRAKPTWQIITTEDHALPTGLQKIMGKRADSHVTEIKSSHVVFISHAKEVADVIAAAAKGASK